MAASIVNSAFTSTNLNSKGTTGVNSKTGGPGSGPATRTPQKANKAKSKTVSSWPSLKK